MIPFISHEDLGAYLQQTFDGSELIVLIALTSGCDAVRDYLHRSLNLAADDEIRLDGNNTATLILPERPVHEVQAGSVTLDGADVDDEFLYLDKQKGILWLTDGSVWTSGLGNVRLTYTHGYALTEDAVTGTIERVPGNIRMVALKLAAGVWRSKGTTSAAAGASTGEHIGSYSYTQDVNAATALASTLLTDDDRMTLQGQRFVVAA